MIGKKISTKMYRRGIEQIQEASSSRKKKDKAVSSFKKMAQKKYSSSRQSSETIKPNANISEINSLNKFKFSQSQNNR